ncbi:MAG: biotin--[acetyl-CoA-carboxylase] ligase [Clostridium sp.]
MKYSLLSILKNSNDYVSGELISTELGVTRASIWKYIKSLKSEGYIIEGISNKGYKLISSPEIINEFEIKSNLETTFIGHNIFHFASIDSTNKKAKELAKKDAIDGSLIISDEQSIGKGRFDRTWISPKGGLWLSLILRPLISPQDASKLTMLAAASLHKTLEEFNIDINIKWPNDLLIKGKKFSGILTEMNGDMDKINYIVLGIGINTNIDEDIIPNELKDKSTSLKIETGKSISNIDVLCTFLKNFESDYIDFTNTLDLTTTINLFRKHSNIINKNVTVHTIRNSFNAKCIDIDSDGNLVLIDDDGNTVIQNSGEISLSKPLV